MFFQLSWRNIWRNRRRTAVILTAIIIGVWSMIFLGGLMRGVADQMVRNGIATLTGHIQVHKKGYRSDPVIDNSITHPETIEKTLQKVLPPAARWSMRVRVNAIATNARHSGAVTLIGINPEKEAGVSFIGQAVREGRYLKPDDAHGIIVGNALLEKFETKLGRKLVMMSQDTGKEIASQAFRIIGIFRAELEATEKRYVFVTLSAAQQMLKMKHSISEVSIILPIQQKTNRTADFLTKELSSVDYEIETWQNLLPMVTAILKMYDGFIFLWFLVVFIAMGFGIVNTTLMAVFERIREFGLLKALGMKPWWIIREVLTESFFLLILGIVVGNIFGIFTIFAFSKTGIDLSSLAEGMEFVKMSRIIYPILHGKDVLLANLVVFILGLFVNIYPAVKAARFTPVEALAHT
jgi:ABC-type lipoprotein release transport system permease subunit